MNNKYIESYLNYIKYERKLSNNTINSYTIELLDLYNYNNNILSNTYEDLVKYFKSRNDLNSRSLSHHRTVINSFYDYLVSEHIISKNPCENISSPKIPQKLPVYLTEEEINKLLDINLLTPYNYRDKAMLELLYATGLRISELVNLKLSDIDFNECFLRVTGKGSKERILPINDTSIKYLKLYIDNYRNLILKNHDSEYLFISNAYKPISRQAFFKFLKKECQRNNITKKISPHVIRHTFASVLLKNGANIRIIQELLGHEDISTTEIYTHLINEQLKKDYQEYHPRSHQN